MDRYEQIAEKILSEIHGIEKPEPKKPPLARVRAKEERIGPIIISYDQLEHMQ